MKGDRVPKSEINDFWPKFFYNSENRPVIVDAPNEIPDDAWVFQPRFGNLSANDRLMVKDYSGSYVFAVEGGLIRWGSMYVRFLDLYRYNAS